MTVETMKEILQWTKEQHEYLSQSMRKCARETSNERVELLLTYLADHEKELARVVSRFDETAQTSALNTWFNEYLEKKPFKFPDNCEQSFAGLDTDEITAQLMTFHENIINLYKHLVSEVETDSVREVLLELQSLEEHEAMRMVQAANRLQDI